MTTFTDLGLGQALVDALDELGFDAPTPIQEQAIPHALDGRDVMGLAQTGSGKTAAFGLPLIQELLERDERAAPRAPAALVLAPTRELANQIRDNIKAFAPPRRLRTAVVVGGVSINRQIDVLGRGVDILVATPGRLIDLIERRAVRLDATRRLVLDEADQMLDLGFIHALRRIAKLLPEQRQTMLFSATMPKQIAELAAAYLSDPIRVEVAPPGVTADKIAQSVEYLPQDAKYGRLCEHLDERGDARSLVFARTKHGAERLKKRLEQDGFDAVSIHGNKSQNQRDRAIEAFRSGEATVLVATDVAARGIDIKAVETVFNFELPNVPEAYVHRIGRTARAGADGEAIAFCAPDEVAYLRDIEKLIGRAIETGAGERPAAMDARHGGGGRRGGGGGRPNRSGGGAGGGRGRQRRRGGGGGRSSTANAAG